MQSLDSASTTSSPSPLKLIPHHLCLVDAHPTMPHHLPQASAPHTLFHLHLCQKFSLFQLHHQGRRVLCLKRPARPILLGFERLSWQ